jgi:lipopolysaccharide transport system ATP-binding protein
MSSVIKVENLSKQYRLGAIGTGSISHDLNRWWHTLRGKEDPYLKIGETNDRSKKGNSEYVWSLKDINFEIEQGDAVGIIGRNGAGKSTLLKILSRVTGPTTGNLKIKGRVASLLEVGTGFHPELSGRENIFLNGAILGMRKHEIQRKFDEIVDFSGVERYIDTPVKRYSSGMYVRLAFAVAAHLESEILIVDEVLAVGDAEFQKKCLGKMGEVNKGGGRTVLFVSHNLGSISQLCDKAILLSNGKIEKIGNTFNVADYYLKQSFSNATVRMFQEENNEKGHFISVKILNANGESQNEFNFGDKPKLEIEFNLKQQVKNFHVAIILSDNLGNHIYSSADTDLNENLLKIRQKGYYKVSVNLPLLNLNTGSYNIGLGMGIINEEIFHRVEAINFNIIDTGDFGTGKEGGRRKGLLLVENDWSYLN